MYQTDGQDGTLDRSRVLANFQKVKPIDLADQLHQINIQIDRIIGTPADLRSANVNPSGNLRVSSVSVCMREHSDRSGYGSQIVAIL